MYNKWTTIVKHFAEGTFVPRQEGRVIDEVSVGLMHLVEQTSDIIIFTRQSHDCRNGLFTESYELAVVPIEEVWYGKI